MCSGILTIDTGTTNTRIIYWEDGQRAADGKWPVGVRNTAVEGKNDRLCDTIKEGMEEVLKRSGAHWSNVRMAVGCGMLTSELGIYQVPHIAAPVNKEQLAAEVCKVYLPVLCPLPIYLIPGVKTSADPVTKENYPNFDMMRGEETEVVAVLEQENMEEPAIVILPGSHDKIVLVNERQQITASLTSLSGELLQAITTDTILADAVCRRFAEWDSWNPEMVWRGYEDARDRGFGRACFLGRILREWEHEPPEAVAHYLLGAVLQSDMKLLMGLTSQYRRVVIAGRSVSAAALRALLCREKWFKTVVLCENISGEDFSGVGALAIARLIDEGRI